jgi:type II secretory pathway component PulC
MRAYFYKFLSVLLSVGLCIVVSGWLVLSTSQPLNLRDRPIARWQPGLETLPDFVSNDAKPANPEEIFSRPLFSPSRRQFVPVVAAEVATPEQAAQEEPGLPLEPVPVFDPSQLVLQGIMMSPGKSLALIASPGQTTGRWLRTGSAINGWNIQQIEKNAVLLSANGQTHLLKQYVDNSGERLGTQPANP